MTTMFKVLSKQLWGTLTTTYERHFANEDFTEMDQHTCKLIMNQHRCKTYVQQNCFLVKHHVVKIGEDACKIVSCTKIQACTSNIIY